jgi:glycosyltransferase involved in cell wall biosynthesis
MPDEVRYAGQILMIIPGLPLGGAEMVFARIASAIAQRRQVVVAVLSPWAMHPDVRGKLGTVPVFFPPFSSGIAHSLLRRLGMLTKGRLAFLNPIDLLTTWFLRRLHKRYRFDVVNAHLLAAERAAALAFPSGDPAIIASDHGDYRWVITNNNRKHFQPALSRVAAMICLSQANIEVARTIRDIKGFSYYKVYNGFEPACGEALPATAVAPRASSPFVFGMVSRGIHEKGWAEAVAAFAALRARCCMPMQLLLVGDGEEIGRLRLEVAKSGIEGVEFAGHQRDTLQFIRRFDVALLPTYYRAESLPTVIVECLSVGVPVIASDIGGIREMLETEDGLAGAVVPLGENGKADVGELGSRMEEMVCTTPIRLAAQENAKVAFRKFDMKTCVDRYLEIFDRHARSSGCQRA